MPTQRERSSVGADDTETHASRALSGVTGILGAQVGTTSWPGESRSTEWGYGQEGVRGGGGGLRGLREGPPACGYCL